MTTDALATREQCKALRTKQLAMAEEWQANRTAWGITIPDDEWPKEWHAADRWRCLHGHVAVGRSRLANCRVCVRERDDVNVPVELTSPTDESDPTEEKTPGCTINATMVLKTKSVSAAIADLGQRLHTLGHSTWPPGLEQTLAAWLHDQIEVSTKITPQGGWLE